MNIIYSNLHIFIFTTDRTMEFQACVLLNSRSADELFWGLYQFYATTTTQTYKSIRYILTAILMPSFKKSIDNLDIAMNYSHPDKHVHDIKRPNITLEVRFGVTLYHLTFPNSRGWWFPTLQWDALAILTILRLGKLYKKAAPTWYL